MVIHSVQNYQNPNRQGSFSSRNIKKSIEIVSPAILLQLQSANFLLIGFSALIALEFF
jgi:hypothetical protein